MRKILLLLVALMLATTLPASAQLTNLPQNYPYQFRSPAKFTRYVTFSLSPQGQAMANVTGTVYRLNAVANSATGGAVVSQFVLPANSLVTTPNGLKIRVHAVCAANANTKVLTFNFGSQAVALLNAAANATDVYADIEVFRTGPSAQRISVVGYANGALLANLSVNTAQAETAAINMNVTLGTATANSDLVLDGFSIAGESD